MLFNKKKLEELEKRVYALEARKVELEGKPFFADKNVQKIVYGAVGVILTAAIASFTGNVPWL